MELALKDVQNSVIKVSKSSFNCLFNEPLVHQVVTAYNTTSRQGTKAQKSRAQVSGSGKKPWRQKGTGRARVGSIRSPIWRSGGITFAAKRKDYTQKVNKKMYKNALKSIFSELIRQNRLIVFNEFLVSLPKTKLLVKKLQTYVLKNVLIIINKLDKNLILSARNLYEVDVQTINKINPVSLIAFQHIIVTVEAIKKIEELLS